ncbi:MAG: 50S ribosomal protein L5 [Candidatus Lloydbacteria bacterium CG22_combo_CG10-13_8_21_14_all_47_15]|uniref:Large ribosomal subunit protein uL5 n=1 Tax=Candidatus Lloydbacteria bacterium CG22_combo_CG10-13_8_21_14_all_47_15 TaxID=1974635 RepID=A0A2H0CVM5_9BACT|nr:MAG: 50S ribosomal protein L5 [Candidatus Lloydbacteria bacterium CG22_combo_CG10-13_8_21_14_all_47_15]
MESTKEKQKTVYDELKGEFGYTNRMATPKIVKVVVSTGTGRRMRTDREWNELVADRLAKITGQKPAPRGAKKSIANFKVRQGEVIGESVTLRGERMYAFLDKLFGIAIPRMRDFRGLPVMSVDEMGNFTTGIREHTIFPETADEDLRDVFGMSVTIVTTAKNKAEAIAFLKHIGVPFKK